MLDELIEQYGKRLYGLCRTLCTHTADADDLYQETWLRVYEKFYQYKPSSPFEPWLTRICVNLYKDSLRKKKASLLFDFFNTMEEKDALLAQASIYEPKDPLVEKEPIHEAVTKLPEKLRVTVILYYFQDLKMEQVAQTLGIPLGTVKSRLNKAKIVLKEWFQDDITL